MNSSLGDDPSSWQHRFADPENPTYEECRSIGFQFLRPGKQCIHPASAWFRDPRPSPSRLPSRQRILAAIYREHTTASESYRDKVLSHYVPREDPNELKGEQARIDAGPSFHLFPLLPAEIRQQIWKLAVPQRVLDLREIRHVRNYTGIRYARLPVPHIAQVCHEARDVVFRLGARLFIASSFVKAGRASTSRFRKHPAGFFVKGSDVVLHLPDPGEEEEPSLQEREVLQPSESGEGVPVEVLTVAGTMISQAMKCEAAAVNWAGPVRHVNRRRDPTSQYLPVSTAQSNRMWLLPWQQLKDAVQTLKTVYVYFRSRYIEVSLVMCEPFRSRESEEDGDPLDNARFVEVQLMVDLYDDQRLSELSSLETSNFDAGNTRPRYATPGARNPGLCLNCERVQWEQQLRPLVECQWLQLHEDELEEEMLEAVFPSDTSVPYNREHPWVKEKLQSAPEFRPVTLIHLQVVQEEFLDNEEREQWADLQNRMVSLR